MNNRLVKQDLVGSILELREDVERQLKANKYYIALQKLDELLAAIKPLDIIEATADPAQREESPAIAAAPSGEPAPPPEATPAPEAPAEAPREDVRVFHGVVEEQVGDPSWAPHEARPA
jgi:hypothetical protein